MSRANRLDLFVFIDALGWEIAERSGFLKDLLPVRSPMDTVLGYSSACDPTIITGLMPQEHGHFSFYYYSPETSPFRICTPLKAIPEFLSSRGKFRRPLGRAIARRNGYTGYFQLYNVPFRYIRLFDYSEKWDIFAPGGINSGAPTIFDRLREENVPFHLSGWKVSEAERIRALQNVIGRGEISFAYLLLQDLDIVLHAEGTGSSRVVACLRDYEQAIKGLVDVARGSYESVNVFVFSDHGMADVHSCCDLTRSIDRLGLRFGEDYVAFYDSTMARFWFLKAGARERITAALREEERGDILTDQKLQEWGCLFEGRKYGELFFLMKPGVLICPSFMGARPVKGMHGYEVAHGDSMACYLSNVPDVEPPARIDGMFGVMGRQSGMPADRACHVIA